jgi:hypothetical protein
VAFAGTAPLVADLEADLAEPASFLAGAAFVVPAGDFFTAVNSTSFKDLPVTPLSALWHSGTNGPPTSTSR